MKRTITIEDKELLFEAARKATGLSQAAFKPIRKAAEQKAKAKKTARIKEEENAEESDRRYEVSPSVTMDMHLHELCFGGKDTVVINDAFYRYEKRHGYWLAMDDRDVMKEVLAASENSYRWVGSKGNQYKKKCGSQASATSALKFARGKLTLTRKEQPENKHLRAFQNCTVDMRTGQSMQHNAKHYLTSAIACEYVDNKECPEIFKQFIETSYGEDMLLIIRAALSMLLDPTAPWGKFIHIVGPSGSGKGVLLRLFQDLFGKENAKGGSSFSDFSDAERRHQNLQGCALYVIGDVAGFQRGLEAFYDLVDNAPMTGRALFSSNAYTEKWNVRFAIASVEYLQLENSAGGWDRRVLPILTQRRSDSDDIPSLETRLAEARGEIISWALAIDRGERDEIIRKPWEYSERISNAMHESKIHGDSIASFVDSCLKPIPYGTMATEPSVHPGLLHDWYLAYCRAHALSPKGKPKFIGHLRTIIPKHYIPRRRAKPGESSEREKDGKLKRLPAKWVWLSCVPSVFESEEDPERGFSKSILVCRKQLCQEGGLELFDFWEPQKEPSGALGGQGGRGGQKVAEAPQQPYTKQGQGGQGGQGESTSFGDLVEF